MYQYPKRTNRIISIVYSVLFLLIIVEYLLAWARAIYALLYDLPSLLDLPILAPFRETLEPLLGVQISLPYIPLLGPFQDTLRTLLIAHVGLFVGLICLRAFAFAAPQVHVLDQGLLFKGPYGTRVIRFDAIRQVRSVELPNGRFVVWVGSTKGLPLHGLAASMLFGEPLWRGFIFTSDLSGFDQVIAQIIGCLRARYAEKDFDAHWKEQSPTWEMRMLNDPGQTIRDMVNLEEPPFTVSQAAQKTTWSTLPLMLPVVAGAIIHLQIPWAALVVFIMGIVEWPLAAGYLSMMPIGEKHDMAIESALAVYPMTLLTRWVPALGLTLFVATGVPSALLLLAALPAVVWGAYPVRVLTEVWFEVKGSELWLGIIATIVYQLILYEALLLMVPR